jgi:hypothetical protein
LSEKTPYLCTLALTKFLLEFLLLNPSVWADKDAFVLPKLEIKIKWRLQGKNSRKISTSVRRLEVTSVEIAILCCVSYFFSSYYFFWVGVVRAGDG